MLSILLVALVAVVGISAYLVQRGLLERRALADLESLANAKRGAVDTLLSRYVSEASLLTADAGLTNFAVDEGERPASTAEVLAVREALDQHFALLRDVQRLELLSSVGTIALSTDPEREGRKIEAGVPVQEAREGPVFGAPSVEQGTLSLVLAIPLQPWAPQESGILALHVDGQRLLEITATSTGMGATSQARLGIRHGEEILFPTLSEAADQRTAPPAGAKTVGERVAPAGGPEDPMSLATAGHGGVLHTVNASGEPVVAAYQPLSPEGWGLVVTQAKSEVFAGLGRMRLLIFAVVISGIGVGAVVVPVIVRRLIDPLDTLVSATEAVAGGDMAVQVPERGGTELVRLAGAFNEMVRRLGRARAKLEEAHGALEHRAADLERLNQDLAKVNAEMKSFTYSVSHDLKSPLVSIRGMVDLLKMELGEESSADTQTYLEHIERSTQSMAQLLGDVLEMSRVGRVDTEPHEVDPRETVEQVVAELLGQTGSRSVEFVIGEDLPRVWCNKKRFYQVLSNLGSNAVKFTHDRPSTRIEFGCRSTNAEPVFFVRDNGRGIPKKDRERVFEMFKRLHGPDVPGTGMGLSFVRRILESMGGRIWLDPDCEDGAMFCFTVPIRSPAGDAPQ